MYIITSCILLISNGHVTTHKSLQIWKQLVTRFLSGRRQDVFTLIVPSYSDKSWTSCYHLVTRLMTVTYLLQQLRVCCPHQPCLYKMITTCSRLVNNWKQAVQWTQDVDKLWDFYPCSMVLIAICRKICTSEFCKYDQNRTKIAHTDILIKVVHEQSGKVEYQRERLLGIAMKIH